MRRSTGVKDIHGKEIFEGDIVRSAHGQFYEHIPSKVEWNEEFKCFNLLGDRFEIVKDLYA